MKPPEITVMSHIIFKDGERFQSESISAEYPTAIDIVLSKAEEFIKNKSQ